MSTLEKEKLEKVRLKETNLEEVKLKEVRTPPLVERRRRVDDHDAPKIAGRQSRFVAAMAIFIAANIACSFLNPLRFDPFKFPYTGWAWWTFNDLRNSTGLHNIALLGSSLMVSAINACDANYGNKTLDLTKYHGATYLDDKLRSTFGGQFHTYNLAAPGQMPSDAYLTLKSMLTTAHRPEVVIYGVAPRDFLDSSMSDPTDTEPFHFLNRLVTTDECASGLYRDPMAKLGGFLNRNLYLSHHAIDYQMLLESNNQRFLAKIAPVPSGGKPFTFWDRVKILPGYKPGEIHEGAVMINALTKEQAIASFRDNTLEYIDRYKKPDPHTYRNQLYFLRKLFKLCKKERIDLIVVNMPISKENINILGPNTYLYYIQAMQQTCGTYKVPFFDLNFYYNYTKDLYHDYVHLNGFGGARFLDSMVAEFKNNPRTCAAFELAGQGLEKEEKLQNQLAYPAGGEKLIDNVRAKLIEQGVYSERRPSKIPIVREDEDDNRKSLRGVDM